MEAHLKAVAPLKVSKQPWRKPTVTFVPLQVTASEVGSGADGGTFEPLPG